MENERPRYKEKKPARRPDDLIVKLRESNLEISEEDELNFKDYIRSIGYYRLSGYFKPFKTGNSFKDGTNYQQIIDLYTFDKELRLMSLHALKTIEINLKAVLSDTLSLAYESDWYVQPDLFDSSRKKQGIVDEYHCIDGNIEIVPVKKDINLYRALLDGIQENVNRNNGKEYLVHLRTKYDKMDAVPSWMMMQCISFGKLSKLFGLLKSAERRDVSRLFGAINPDAFPSWLESFVVLRNLSAHHERAWNWKFPGGLSFPSREKHRFVTKIYGVENHPDNEHILYYYGVSACILKVLEKIAHTEYTAFKSQFWTLVKKYGVDVSAMGFPDTFDSYDIWKPDV